MKPILLVEDNADDTFFMRRALKGAGIANPLVVLGDGQAALDYMQGQGAYENRRDYPPPGLALLDLNLPLRNGFEVLQWIRSQSQWENLPVVVLTMSAESADADKGRELGANASMVKPPSPAKLLGLVKLLNLDWVVVQEPATKP